MTHEEELNKAAEEYTKRMIESWSFDSTGLRPFRESFIAGAKWAMEQGESFVASVDYCDGFYIDTTDQEQEVIEKLGLKVMDKVIVQIRKKDE